MLLFFFLQTCFAYSQTIEYTYDAAGNRTGRTVILLSNPQGLKSARHDTAAGLRGEQQPQDNTALPQPVLNHVGTSTIKIYPNPTAGMLTVEVTGLEPAKENTLVVYTVEGKEIFALSRLTGRDVVLLGTQPAGVYIMRISLGGVASEYKIIKE